MMKIVFLGVGEACDETLPNTSVWVQTEGPQQHRSILLDCGFTVPSPYWQQTDDPDDLDGLWISHFHADHFFGVPALLLRFWETQRRKPLLIIGQTGIEELIRRTMELAYPGFFRKLSYPLQFEVIEADAGPRNILGLTWSCAATGHGQRDLAVRIATDRRSIFYSGDGPPTAATRHLAQHCDLIVHEAFELNHTVTGHGTVQDCIGFARQAQAGMLALVHLQRDVRRMQYQRIVRICEEIHDLHVLLPQPGDEIQL